jgi:hypothetical protein
LGPLACGADVSLAFLRLGEEESVINQMRANLSLFSFWGLIFALAAVVVFVVVSVYKNNAIGGGKNDMIDDLRRRSVAVYLAAETSSSVLISHKLRDASNEIERLRGMNLVMFWLIIAMNTLVIGLLLIGYRTF